MSKSYWLWPLFLVLLFNQCGKTPPTAEKPNIVLIAVDTLRADHLGCYGYPLATSPRIDALAKNSLFFEHAFCPIPKTSSSFASMMTGLHPFVHKTRPNRGPLDERFTTLAEVLKADGYYTAAVVDNANLSSFFKFNQGFDAYTEVWNETEEKSQSTPFITAKVLDFLQSPPKKPFFLWVNFIEPHVPYIPPKEFIPPRPLGRDLRTLKKYLLSGRMRREMMRNNNFSEGYYVARYDGAVRFLDSEFGKIVDRFFASGLDRNTILIFTADHGEDLGERNYFFDHGALTFTASVRVPLVVHFPGRAPRAERRPVSVMDIYPTILEQLKVKPPYPLQGVSLLTPRKDRSLFIVGIGTHAVVKGDRHFVELSSRLAKKLDLPPSYLFDFFLDPRETHNLYDKEITLAQELARQYEGFAKEHGGFLLPAGKNGRRKLTDKEKKSLETLGYL
jgi:arylsulfatase